MVRGGYVRISKVVLGDLLSGKRVRIEGLSGPAIIMNVAFNTEYDTVDVIFTHPDAPMIALDDAIPRFVLRSEP